MITYLRVATLAVLVAWQPCPTVATEIKPLKPSEHQRPARSTTRPMPTHKPVARPDFAVMIVLPVVLEDATAKGEPTAEKKEDWSLKMIGISTENLIQTLLLLTAIAAFIIAAVQFSHVKRVEANKLTIDLWKQFLEQFDTVRWLNQLFKHPMDTTPSDFLKLQQIRSWIDGVATLGAYPGVINNKMIKRLGLQIPIRDFMSALEKATADLKQIALSGVPRAQEAYAKYQNEMDLSAGIFEWLNKLGEKP